MNNEASLNFLSFERPFYPADLTEILKNYILGSIATLFIFFKN